MKKLIGALARTCARHRWLTLTAWLVVVPVVAATAFVIGPDLQDDVEVTGSDSHAAAELLAAQGGTDRDGQAPSSRIVIAGDDIASRTDVIAEVVRRLSLATGQRIADPLADPRSSMQVGAIAPDGDALMLTVEGDPKTRGREWQKAVDAALDPARDAGLDVAAGAPLGTQLDRSGHVSSELIGLAVALVVLLVALGSAAAAMLPVATGSIAVVAGVGSVWLLSTGFPIPDSAVTLAVMVGLGVGIDYALFLLSRFRQALREGSDVVDAVAATGRTAGEAGLIAGLTVALCATSLAISGVEFVAWLGLATAIVVLFAVASTLTLTPAVLAIIGRRALPRRERFLSHGTDDPPAASARPRRGLWDRIAPRLTRHPLRSGVAALVLLVAVSMPTIALHLGQSSPGNAAPGSNQRTSYDLVAAHWGAGHHAPLILVGKGGKADEASWTLWGERIALVEGVASVSRATSAAGVVSMVVIPETGPSDAATVDLVRRLRTETIPASGWQAHVGGAVATRIDLSDRIAERLAWLIALVILAAMVLIAITFQSVLLPLKAALCNVLSITAAFGVLVWVFQEGHGVQLVGLDEPMPLDPYVPMMLFAVLFGLSMDYEIFLLTAVRQAWERGSTTKAAVTRGLAETGGVISAAAIIMIAVFLSFALSPNPVIKVFGVGLAAAVLIDATVIRLLLAPAILSLLGERAWWWPGRPSSVRPSSTAS